MTPTGEQLCYRTPTPARSRRGSARSSRARRPLVVLDRTVFYPGGGGQPSDRGLLLRDGRRPVVDRPGGAQGRRRDRPRARARRRRAAARSATSSRSTSTGRDGSTLMRTHTALHALCGVVWRDYGALVTGGNMEPGTARMDFEFERMSGDLVDAIEATVNAELAAQRDVRVERPAARRGVRDPGPHPDEGQPPARGHRGDPDDRDRRARPPGRRRHPRRQHPRGRRDPGDRLRVQGPDQQAHPDRAHRPGLTRRRALRPP